MGSPRRSGTRASARTVNPNNMPEPAASVAGHVHVPLFYVLLSSVGYPKPDLAFRFFSGAPLNGEFRSSALPERVVQGAELTDVAIRAIAADCLEQCRRMKATLPTDAGIESMTKMLKEFADNAMVGLFPSFEALCLGLQEEMRKVPGVEDFALGRSLVAACPQFSVDETDGIQNSASAAANAAAGDPHELACSFISEIKIKVY